MKTSSQLSHHEKKSRGYNLYTGDCILREKNDFIDDMKAETESKGRKKVLVIDDDDDILNWFRLFEKPESPFSVIILRGEHDIPGTIAKVKPDLIFMDLYQSHAKEKKLSEIIRISQDSAIPVVHMSAREISGSEIANQSFMRKPLERKAVEAKIRLLLKIK